MRKLCALAVVLALLCLVWLGRAQRGGPAHLDFVIPGGIPATLYVPGEAQAGPFRFPEPPPLGEAPPAVLLVHGYSADRAGMSVLARRLARNGYAVLAIDVRGHGANARPFAQDPEGANLSEDLATAADWLRASAWADGGRLAVMGHSMGAGAALRFAERDVGVDASVMISGGFTLLGPLRPANALFVYASADPESIRTASERLATRLAGAAEGEPGSFATRDAVRAVEIPGNDHTTILWSKAAAREIVGWLDASFGVTRAGELDLAEPRATPALLAALLLPLCFVGLGLAIGGLAPIWPPQERRDWAGLLSLALALVAALPLVSASPLARFVGLAVADVLGGLLLCAGLLLCGIATLRADEVLGRDTGGNGPAITRSLIVGGVGFFGVYALLAPLAGLAHDMTPIGPRAFAGLKLGALLLPFFVGFEHHVRGGSVASSLAFGLAGRAVVLLVILLGVWLGVVPFVVTLLLGPLALVLLLGELCATGIYAAGGNRLASATLQALFLGWVIASVMPLAP
jgi:dienelactone hydrolase